MHLDSSVFTEYHKLKYYLFVGGIKSGLRVTGISLVLIMNKAGNVGTLKRTLHVPKLKHGLMSLIQLGNSRWKLVIEKEVCTVSNGDFVISSKICNRLCWWLQDNSTDSAAFIALLTESMNDESLIE